MRDTSASLAETAENDSVAASPSATFSATVRFSNSEKCWNTIPMPRARACAGPASATVLAEQRVYLSRPEVEIDPVVREEGSVALGDAQSPQQRRAFEWNLLRRRIKHHSRTDDDLTLIYSGEASTGKK